MKINPCACGNKKLIHIKSFGDYHMIKCERCVVQIDGYMVHKLSGGNTHEDAIREWNKENVRKVKG